MKETILKTTTLILISGIVYARGVIVPNDEAITKATEVNTDF